MKEAMDESYRRLTAAGQDVRDPEHQKRGDRRLVELTTEAGMTAG
jgi:hypothetical protein